MSFSTSPSVKKPKKRRASSPPPSSKKKKVSDEGCMDQGVEQLRDVVAVSGVNLVEEQEGMLLLSGPKQVSRKLVLEEEEGLVLQKIPLRKKLARIIARCGLRISIDKDVERCLSMCVEERMRGIICNLIRQSKQRVDDAEKSRHHTVSTSDVKQEIMILNKKAREAEAQNAQKINEPEVSISTNRFNGDKDKHDDGHAKTRKTTAANVAALAALGGYDILAKWQLKAEQLAWGKRQGKDVNHKATSTVGRTMNGNLEAEKKGGVEDSVSAAGGSVEKFGRNYQVMIMPQTKVASTRSISVKDVIAVLEKEPQMSKSSLIYLLLNTASR